MPCPALYSGEWLSLASNPGHLPTPCGPPSPRPPSEWCFMQSRCPGLKSWDHPPGFSSVILRMPPVTMTWVLDSQPLKFTVEKTDCLG